VARIPSTPAWLLNSFGPAKCAVPASEPTKTKEGVVVGLHINSLVRRSVKWLSRFEFSRMKYHVARIRSTMSSSSSSVMVPAVTATRRLAPKNDVPEPGVMSPGIVMSNPLIALVVDCVGYQSDMTKPWKPNLPFRMPLSILLFLQAYAPLTRFEEHMTADAGHDAAKERRGVNLVLSPVVDV